MALKMRTTIPSSALRAPLTTRPARSQVANIKVGSPLPRSERSVVEKSSSASTASIASSSSPFAPSRRRVRAFSTAEEQTETSAATCRARSTLDGDDLAAWEATSALVASTLEISEEESDELLTTAFGWGRSTYWRGSVEEATPDPAAVRSSLSFLLAATDAAAASDAAAAAAPSNSHPNDLSLSRAEALAVLRSFPETLNLDAEEQLRGNLAKLAKEWKIQGPAAAGCVKRTPRLLGYTVDCAGDCIGLCDRCWVRF